MSDMDRGIRVRYAGDDHYTPTYPARNLRTKFSDILYHGSYYSKVVVSTQDEQDLEWSLEDPHRMKELDLSLVLASDDVTKVRLYDERGNLSVTYEPKT